MKQKTEIIFEVEETIVRRQGEMTLTTFCPQCQGRVEMVTPQFAAVLSGKTEREVFRLIEMGEVHFVETGRVSICLISLTENLKEK
jgi:hypothetical protein